MAYERDQLDEFFGAQLGEAEGEELFGKAMITKETAHDFNDQPLAGHQLFQRTVGSQGFNDILAQAGLAPTDFVASPRKVSLEFPDGSQDDQFAVGLG